MRWSYQDAIRHGPVRALLALVTTASILFLAGCDSVYSLQVRNHRPTTLYVRQSDTKFEVAAPSCGQVRRDLAYTPGEKISIQVLESDATLVYSTTLTLGAVNGSGLEIVIDIPPETGKAC